MSESVTTVSPGTGSPGAASPVSIVIADDEAILLESLAGKLAQFWPQARIVARAGSGEEALEAIDQLQPQVAFLDIQMGEVNGLDVAARARHACHYVFITAYDKYAVAAFETGAIDYLLKPYSNERLQDCIARVQKRLQAPPVDIIAALRLLHQQGSPYLRRLKVQIGARIWLIPVDEVICLKAAGRYVQIITREREGLVRLPLKSLLAQLDPDRFWHIHRSIVINIDQLDHVRAGDAEQYYACMKGLDEALPISRSAQHLFRTPSMD